MAEAARHRPGLFQDGSAQYWAIAISLSWLSVLDSVDQAPGQCRGDVQRSRENSASDPIDSSLRLGTTYGCRATAATRVPGS